MKLSETLLRFARPLTGLLPPQAEAADLELMLEFAQLVWNAVVLEELGRKSHYLEQAREVVRASLAEPGRSAVLGILADMAKRKRAETPPDLRLIGEIGVDKGPEGDLRLRVTQVAPPREAKGSATDTWAELYSAAREFHSLAPWHWMPDRDIFGLRDPASGEIGWCCALGAGGELCGLAVYRGDVGFDFHRRLQAGEFEQDEAVFGQDALLLAFVDRSDIDERELQRLRRLGIKFRGAGRWPQLESHAAGRLPVPLSDVEAERMLHTLRAAIEVIAALREVPRWIEPDPEGRLLVRSLREGEWHDERVAPPEPIEIVVPKFDAVRAERLRRQLKPGGGVLECDLHAMPMVIEEREDHPYMPASFLLVDPGSGAIVHQQIGKPKDRNGMAQSEFMTGLERLGVAPATVRVKRRSLARVLAPVGAALGVELSVVDKLPMMEEVQAMAAEFFRRAPSSRGRR